MSGELSAGQAFGGYHIVELVGSGGMGLVYRAEQRILGRTVALKVIRPEIAESGDYRERFLREARFAAAVDDPHVVSVFDAGEQEGRLYLAMQWVDGPDLGTVIDRQQRLAPERVVLIGVQLAQALQAVHDAGLLHRDVKPSNVLVRDIGGRDHAYLTDFGIAKAPATQDGLTRTGSVMGTPAYLSPEQIRGQQPSPRSDLYALGCIIFEALTGQRPFPGDDLAARWAQATSPAPAASTVCPALGSRYDAFIAQALAVDPQDRFSSGTAFAEALQAAQTGRPGGLTQPAATRGAPTPSAYGPSAQPPAASGTGPETAAPSSDARDPAALQPAGSQPAGPTPTVADRTAGATAPTARASRSTRPPGAIPRGRVSRVLGAGQLIAVIGSLLFIASVALLTHYVNNGTGWKSLWQATHGDLASPLYSNDFWIPVGLAALVFIFTAISAILHKRLVMIGTAVASVGLIGYVLYIPSQGSSPGFQPYGSSYWLSLAATITMVIGAALALAARSRAPGPRRSPRGTQRNPVR
ncbi:MAG TPA: protein kinase [Streptosporangiaceae bacterium]|nr:protein kinase [Streptosporangiaceae bacterium]